MLPADEKVAERGGSRPTADRIRIAVRTGEIAYHDASFPCWGPSAEAELRQVTNSFAYL